MIWSSRLNMVRFLANGFSRFRQVTGSKWQVARCRSHFVKFLTQIANHKPLHFVPGQVS